MTTAVFILSKNNVLNCQLDNVHATQTQVPGVLSHTVHALSGSIHCKPCYSTPHLCLLSVTECAKSIESKGTYLHAKTLLYRCSKVLSKSNCIGPLASKEKRISQHHVLFNIIIFTITIQIISITYGTQSSERDRKLVCYSC